MIFQQVTYGGMPVVVEALDVFKARARGARGVGGVSEPAAHPVLAAAVEAARAAGEIALGYYRGGFDVTIKPDQTPVTQADREAEQAITGDARPRLPRLRLPRRGVRRDGAAGPALDHRSHRRHQELRAAHSRSGRC